MAPPVNKPGHRPDVTVRIITKETGVTHAQRDIKVISVKNVLRGSGEKAARNVPLVSKVTNARNVLRDSKVMVARNVPPVSKVTSVGKVL